MDSATKIGAYLEINTSNETLVEILPLNSDNHATLRLMYVDPHKGTWKEAEWLLYQDAQSS